MAALNNIINVLSVPGRHKLYTSLLHTVSHGGVLGLLVHGIKNEVDTALKVISDTCKMLHA